MATETKNETEIIAPEIEIPRKGRGRPPTKPVPTTLEEVLAAGKLYRENSRIAAKKTYAKNVELKKFVCPTCQKAFGTRQSFKYHTEMSKIHA